MSARALSFYLAIGAGTILTALPAAADSIVCYSAAGFSTKYASVSCTPSESPKHTLDWGYIAEGTMTGGAFDSNLGGLGGASLSTWPMGVGATVNAAIGNYSDFCSLADAPRPIWPTDCSLTGSPVDSVRITSSGELQRADNTALAWNGSGWRQAVTVNPSLNYFPGNFGAPSSAGYYPTYGDELLGATGGSASPVTITMTFQNPLDYVAFWISSETNPDFTAYLAAFDTSGSQLGTYKLVDTGDGGPCAGLNTSSGPTPCNSAPMIQYMDPASRIGSIEVYTDDPSGFFIDALFLGNVTPAQEPGGFLYALGGLAVAGAAMIRHAMAVRA